MRILKKNGMTQYFEITKVQTSIANSAYDIEFIFTGADMKVVSQDIEKVLVGLRGAEGVVSTYEVRGVVCDVLVNVGFFEVAKAYMNLA